MLNLIITRYTELLWNPFTLNQCGPLASDTHQCYLLFAGYILAHDIAPSITLPVNMTSNDALRLFYDTLNDGYKYKFSLGHPGKYV